MAALASSAPPPTASPALELVAAADAWTDEEIAHAAALVKAAHADREHWLLGDWLAPRVPVGSAAARPAPGARFQARPAGRRVAQLPAPAS
jgi:hypothetical protein